MFTKAAALHALPWVTSAILLILAITFFVLWVVKEAHTFTPHFEKEPLYPHDVLSCEQDTKTFWAQNPSSDLCYFSGNYDLAGPEKAVTERDVREKCLSMVNCGGYVKRTVFTYNPCLSSTDPQQTASNCKETTYNGGLPEYWLVAKGAPLHDVPAITRGAKNEVETVTYLL